ncbi:methyl-accepting chemotaxis protein, partial [Bradyrhizobium sp. YR681]|uniref:HAMP domain-containing protein n=1 Tax=Bradyrhizobium sp. YR681 TaxID=1144344 RepID=UPI000271504A
MPSLRLNIRGRLYAGFSILVVVGLIMAGVAIWNLGAVQGQMARLSSLADNTARVQEISINLQALRRANLRYIYDADEPAFKEAAEREAATVELLKAAAKSTISEERLKIYNGLVGDIEKMKSLRERMGAAINAATKGKAALLAGGDELTASSGKVAAAAAATGDTYITSSVADLESKILLVRVANWRFLALRDVKGPATFRANADQAQQRLVALEKEGLPDEVKATLGPVKTALSVYKAAFETASAAVLEADEIYRNNIAPLIAESVDKLKVAETGLKADYQKSRALANGVISNTTLIQEIAGALAVVFGGLVAFLIGRSIAGPLTTMTRAMGALAGGDLKVEIPGRGHRDEIGDMAKAIQVFKESMVETERLREEQVATEARQAEQRKADMRNLAGEFERAVGEIVDTVSSASTELEASAGTLTNTATRARDLSTEVASASQEASANV